MKWSVAVMLVMLVGCMPVDVSYRGYGDTFDAITDRGVAFRIVPGGWYKSTALRSGVGDLIDNAFSGAQTCLGVAMAPSKKLIVVFIDELPSNNDGAAGRYWWLGDDEHLIEIEVNTKQWSPTKLALILEHEMVHYVLRGALSIKDATHENGCYPHGTVINQDQRSTKQAT